MERQELIATWRNRFRSTVVYGHRQSADSTRSEFIVRETYVANCD